MNTPMKLKQLSISICIAVGLSACSGLTPVLPVSQDGVVNGSVAVPLMQPVILSLDENSVPDYIHAGAGSTLVMSDARYIMGKRALRWDWTNNSAFVIRQPIRLITDSEARQAWGRNATQVLSFWIYNDTPVDADVVVDLGRGLTGTAAADAGFNINMNFTGWRAVGVSLENDIQGREVEGLGITDNAAAEGMGMNRAAGGPRSDMDSIRFTAPTGVEQGTFYVDRVMLSVDDARYQWSDDQVKTRFDVPEIDFNLPKHLPMARADEIAAADSIRRSLVDVFTNTASERGLKMAGGIDVLRAKFATLNLGRDELGNLSGRHIITGKQKIIYQPEFMADQDKVLFSDYISLADYSSLLFNIGRQWNTTTSTAEKQELADMYVLMTEHLLDQGYADGSSLVTTHHWGYSGRWWYISAMLMSDVLTEHQLRKPVYDALVWYSREFKANFDMVSGPESSDLDYFNTLSRQHLAMLMLEPDVNRRVVLLRKFGKYIDLALSQTPPGGYDGLRPDGTAWRHEGNYPGYSFAAFKHAAQLVYMLNGTPYEVGEKGRRALKKAMLAAWVYSNPEVGLGLSGRHPMHPPKINFVESAYRWLALTGDLAGTGEVDHELAAVYLQITGKTAADSVALFGERIEPATLPQGYWAYNGGAFGIHRYQDKMVTMKAYNSNVWSSEIYYRNNRYGRYQSHGAVQITPYGKQADIGFVENGWDWNRNPGATTIHLPLEQLDSPNTHTLMLRGTQPFSGASSLDGKYGMFAFKHQAPSMAKFDSSFTARKTTYSVDNRLVMLGSDINNGTDEFSTETTLFQHGITPHSSTIWVNGEQISALPYLAQLAQGDWLIDGQGNGYLMIGDAKVEVRRQHQISADNAQRKKTEGDFAVAWIDHGTAPDDAGYEYLTILDATPEKMTALSADLKAGKKPYTVIQKDETAHVVYDRATDVTAYTAFESASFEDSLVLSMGKPSIVMTKVVSDDVINISAVTPDLNMTRYTAAKPTNVPVILRGQWQAVTPNEKVSVVINGDTTELNFTCYFGMPQQVTLQRGTE